MLDVWLVDQCEANLQPSCAVTSSWCCPQLPMQQMEIYWSVTAQKERPPKGSLQSRWLSPFHIDYHVVPHPPAIDRSQLAWGKMHSCTQIHLKFKNESWSDQPALASGTILPPEAWAQIWLTWLQLLSTSGFFLHTVASGTKTMSSCLVATPRIQHILEPEISLVSVLISEKFPHRSLATPENTRLNNS